MLTESLAEAVGTGVLSVAALMEGSYVHHVLFRSYRSVLYGDPEGAAGLGDCGRPAALISVSQTTLVSSHGWCKHNR